MRAYGQYRSSSSVLPGTTILRSCALLLSVIASRSAMRLHATFQRTARRPFQASQTPPVRPPRCSVLAHTSRRDVLLSGLVATGGLLLPVTDASAAAAAAAPRKPFCAVVDQVVSDAVPLGVLPVPVLQLSNCQNVHSKISFEIADVVWLHVLACTAEPCSPNPCCP
jgi:hypothetical protein